MISSFISHMPFSIRFVLRSYVHVYTLNSNLEGEAADCLVHAADHHMMLIHPHHPTALGTEGQAVFGGVAPSLDGVEAGISADHSHLVLYIILPIWT